MNYLDYTQITPARVMILAGLLVVLSLFSKSEKTIIRALLLTVLLAVIVNFGTAFFVYEAAVKVCESYENSQLNLSCDVDYTSAHEASYLAKLSRNGRSSGTGKNLIFYTYFSPQTYFGLGLNVSEKIKIVESDDFKNKLEDALREFDLLKKSDSGNK